MYMNYAAINVTYCYLLVVVALRNLVCLTSEKPIDSRSR